MSARAGTCVYCPAPTAQCPLSTARCPQKITRRPCRCANTASWKCSKTTATGKLAVPRTNDRFYFVCTWLVGWQAAGQWVCRADRAADCGGGRRGHERLARYAWHTLSPTLTDTVDNLTALPEKFALEGVHLKSSYPETRVLTGLGFNRLGVLPLSAVPRRFVL